jgi:hypothetical protein
MLSNSSQISAKIARIFVDLPLRRLVSAYVLCAVFLLAPVESFAAMQSANYRIYEATPDSSNVAGPIITAVSAASVSASGATIAWQTDQQADSYVIYGTDPGFADGFEYGLAALTGPGHSIVLGGLTASTKYFYQVKSTNSAGGTSVKNDGNSFTTMAAAQSTQQAPGGGGIVFIDNSDKIVPTISDFDIPDLTATSARVSWKTDEPADSFVQATTPDGVVRIFGQWDETASHQVEMLDLSPLTRYNFKVLSADRSGNMAISANHFLKTLEMKIVSKPPMSPKPISQSTVSRPAVNPVRAADRQPAAGDNNRTVSSASNPSASTSGTAMTPQKTSYVQAPASTSAALASKNLRISNFSPKIISPQHAVFRWLTNLEADTRLLLTPIIDGQPAFDKAVDYTAKKLSMHHQVEFRTLEEGSAYQLQIFAKAKDGKTDRMVINEFRTVEKKPAVQATTSEQQKQQNFATEAIGKAVRKISSLLTNFFEAIKALFSRFRN